MKITIPIERTRAVVGTHEFLKDLVFGKYPRVPKAVKDHAKWCLRHYPSKSDLALTNMGFKNEIAACPFAHPDEKF